MSPNPRIVWHQVRFLRKRDGDSCWLCGELIDFEVPGKDDPMRYSRDHVFPRSQGGPGTLDNMRLAHRRCNSMRAVLWPETIPAGLWPPGSVL